MSDGYRIVEAFPHPTSEHTQSPQFVAGIEVGTPANQAH